MMPEKGHFYPLHVMCFIKKYLKGKCLDLGCGDFRNTFWVKKVVGIDIKKPSPTLPIPFVRYDLNKLPLPFKDNQFDTILASHVLEHLESPYLVLKECKRILRSNGILIIGMPNIHSIFTKLFQTADKKPYHINLLCEETVENMVIALGFKVIKKYYNWFKINNKLFGYFFQFLPKSLKPDFWLVCRKEKG